MLIFKKKLVLSVCLLVLNPCSGHGQQFYQAPYFADAQRVEKVQKLLPEIHKLYQDYAAKKHFPGYAFGIVMDGRVIDVGSGGFTDVSKKTAVTPQSMFRIASMTKSFTAMAILKLRDGGKLSLDDRVETYIPELKDQKLTQDSSALTIRNLLTHSGGFPEDNPWGDRQLERTDDQLVSELKQGVSFSNTSGVGYEYSNLGFAILGEIIKKVSGVPFQDYIAKNIWKPLGMKDAAWEYTTIDPNQLAHGYRWKNNQWQEENLLHDGSFGAMGGMITNIDSFTKYMALHLNAWPARNDSEDGMPVRRSSIREMHQPWRFYELNQKYKFLSGDQAVVVKAYGYGLRWLTDQKKRVFVGHSGGLPGFGSNWAILPEYGLGVVFFANLTYAATDEINMEVLNFMINKAGLKPRQLPASDILKTRQKELVEFLPNWDGAQKSAIFADNFFLDSSVEDLKSKTGLLFAKAGKILHIKDITPENQLRESFVIECEKMILDVSFSLTPEKEPCIQSFEIKEN